MSDAREFDFDDWLNRWDMAAVPDLDDKLRECEFFFGLLVNETDRNKFRWLVSGFLNAAYSFFETSALTAFFRFTDPDSGEPREDSEALEVLRKHVRVFRKPDNPNFVKTSALTPLTKQVYEFRKKSTHHFALTVMATGPTLPDDFHFGSMRGEGTPVLPICRETMGLIRTVHEEIHE